MPPSMMTLTQAIVLGLVQGLGEFLPISSSAHLAIVPWALAWTDPGLAVDVALHLGTLIAILVYFRADLLRLGVAFVKSVIERRVGDDKDRRLAWLVVLGSIPGALVGLAGWAYWEAAIDAVQGALQAWSLSGAVLQWLNEARSGQAVGSGVYLGTAHGAKGLEFRVVAVLGDWRVRGDADADSEAERRLYYVAMTRAREVLLLCARRDCPAPMLKRIEGDCRFERPQPPGIELPAAVLAQRYEVLTLEDVYLGYAGLQADGAAIHRALAAAQPGDALTLAADGEHLHLLDAGGRRLARLSKAAAARWRARLDRVRRVTLLALVVRRREDEDAAYRDRSKRESWLVPVAEVMLDGN